MPKIKNKKLPTKKNGRGRKNTVLLKVKKTTLIKLQTPSSKPQMRGITLIEVLIVACLITLAFLGVFGTYNSALLVLQENKARAGAITVGNQTIETIRNMPYSQVGTVSGIPAGIIPQSEIITKNKVAYTVSTYIEYQDDPFDYLATTPSPNTDPLPADYKNVRVEVAWIGPFGEKSIILNTQIVPQGQEGAIGGGTLLIRVLDSNIQPVSQADVRVKSTSTNVDITTQTNDSGERMLVGLPASNSTYAIFISKNGYSTDYTCAISATGTNCINGFLEPIQPHVSILEGKVEEAAFYIDRVSTFNIRTVNMNTSTVWKINTDSGSADQRNVAVSIDDDNNLYYTWVDDRGSADRIYSQKYSSSTTALWSPDIQQTTSNNQAYPTIITVPSSSDSYIAWADDKNGNEDIYLKKINSSGQDLWSGDKKINTDATNADQGYPQLALDSSSTNVFIVFWDARSDSGDIYMQKYNAAGSKIFINDIKVNSDGGNDTQNKPKIARNSQNYFYVVWEDSRNGDYNIYLQKIDTNGNKIWSTDTRVNVTTTGNQTGPDIAIDANDNIYITWEDNRDGNYDIYLQKLDADGVSSFGADHKINTDNSTTNQRKPSIAIGDLDSIYISWVDGRNGNDDIYMQRVDSSGGLQWTPDMRMNADSTTANQSNPDIIVGSDHYPIVVWEDSSAGSSDVYSAKFTAPGTTNIGNVPITLTGAKFIARSPQTYKYTKSFTTDANGFLTIPNLEYDSYTFTVSGGRTLIGSEPTSPVTLLANGSITVWLNVK